MYCFVYENNLQSTHISPSLFIIIVPLIVYFSPNLYISTK